MQLHLYAVPTAASPPRPPQVGAVIVNGSNVILGIGYNGFPRGCCDSDLPWAKVGRGEERREGAGGSAAGARVGALRVRGGSKGSCVCVTSVPVIPGMASCCCDSDLPWAKVGRERGGYARSASSRGVWRVVGGAAAAAAVAEVAAWGPVGCVRPRSESGTAAEGAECPPHARLQKRCVMGQGWQGDGASSIGSALVTATFTGATPHAPGRQHRGHVVSRSVNAISCSIPPR